jgi:uncharacterized cupin superfamily protein
MNSKTPSAIKATDAPKREGTGYPKPYNEPCMKRSKAILGDVFGLDQFGVNLVTMPPGTWSAQRHWHEKEDEFIYVMEGNITLSDDDGDHILSPGMCAGFKANNGNGHCLKNLTDKPVVYLEVGTRSVDEKVVYSDIDMKGKKIDGQFKFLKKDGTPY